MLDFLNDKPKDPILESTKELRSALENLNSPEAETQTDTPRKQVAPESFPLADAFMSGISDGEVHLLHAILTSDCSAAAKQAALEALKPSDEDTQRLKKLLIEIERKYGAKVVMDPVVLASMVYSLGLFSRIKLARFAIKAVGG